MGGGKWKGITSTSILFPDLKREDMKQTGTRKEGRRVIWEYMGITLLEPSNKAGKDPCLKCWAKGLCDDGECGRKLFPLFVNDRE